MKSHHNTVAAALPTHQRVASCLPLQEVKHCEGHFSELRKRGAPDEGPAYADADAASQVCSAVGSRAGQAAPPSTYVRQGQPCLWIC